MRILNPALSVLEDLQISRFLAWNCSLTGETTRTKMTITSANRQLPNFRSDLKKRPTFKHHEVLLREEETAADKRSSLEPAAKE
mmetsp:Transcript_10483/g.11410  ORF Transcript_10483/g.11410 Transcript_10483/m.11410 type:complete len:84 (-) Transcript_10483:955-1206(-)